MEKLPTSPSAMVKLQIVSSENVYCSIDKNTLTKYVNQNYFYSTPITYKRPQIERVRLQGVTENTSPEFVLEKVVQAREDLTEDEKKAIILRGKQILTCTSDNEEKESNEA
jgi:hypothetical protein